MPAPISVVIPTLNSAEELPGTLASLIEGLEAGVIRELVVSDGGSKDATLTIADEAGAGIVRGARGRGGQLVRGVRAAKGDWYLLLHADTQLAPGWAGAVAGHIRSKQEKAGYFRLAFRATGLMPRLVEMWANARSRVLGLPYGDQGLLISRQLLTSTGGIPEIPLMEDVALARALKGKMTMLDGTALTSARRYQEQGWIRRGGANLVLLLRYLLGADPAKLDKAYSSEG